MYTAPMYCTSALCTFSYTVSTIHKSRSQNPTDWELDFIKNDVWRLHKLVLTNDTYTIIDTDAWERDYPDLTKNMTGKGGAG